MKTTKYIITDPCYILNEETWQEVCHECFDDTPKQYEKFDERISEELNKLAGTTNAVAAGTGFGDWSNTIYCNHSDKVLHSNFFADSGMVCVVEYNDRIIDALNDANYEHLIDNGGAALIETEGDIVIDINTEDPNWTVLSIRDSENNIFHSIDENKDEDDEDEWYDEDEDEC